MSITATILTQNSQSTLEACLASLRDAVDEIVVVDTGSRDETLKIAQAGADKVLQYPWGEDFAAARNAALELAQGAWILNLQPDEELAPESRVLLRERLTSYDYDQPVLLSARVVEPERQPVYAGRLFPNHPWIRFKGRAHEWPAWQGKWMDGIECPELVLYRRALSPEAERSRLRQDTLLLRKVLAECEDAGERMVYFKHLGHDALALGQYETALDAFERGYAAWESSDSPAGALLKHLLMTLIKVSKSLGRSAGDTLPYAQALVRCFPEDAESWLLLGQSYFWLEQGAEAESAYDCCLRLTERHTQPGRHAFQARLGLARLALNQNRPETGIALLRVLYQQEPKSELAWHLCRAYTLLDALPSARHWYQLAFDEPAPHSLRSMLEELREVPVWSPAENRQLLGMLIGLRS